MDLQARKEELQADLATMEQRLHITQENAKALTVDTHRLSGAIAMIEEQLAAVNGNTAEVVAE
jgi:septal ring factor EnvC (AmiA/AmiB activator)